MRLDIRIPIGLMFGAMGLVLVIYGLISQPHQYDRSLGININVWWGIAISIFGGVMLLLAFIARQKKIISKSSKDEQEAIKA